MRLFLAVDLPDVLLQKITDGIRQLQELAGGLGNFRWVASGNMHLTLKFLGEMTDSQTEMLIDCCAAGFRLGNVTLTLGKTGFFPSAVRPRIFWQGFAAGAEALRMMAAQADECAARVGVPREGRSYVPHLTLARIKQVRTSHRSAFRRFQQVAENLLPVGGEFFVGESVLYESRLTSLGAEYRRLAIFPMEQ
ncbi:MAG: RNA 2',3'-cyclic phosphodiesterase [Deltaproteobacteria bacterium]|nr:RNA 2',3'-cyclic phosphodiesterase [Candidatus Anaeroferrophillus wilburensis]MBN2888629.1 RNA 2',3'-cyclic phosphodiesterase [Deltaproteobacteria bacterium]